MEWAGLPTLGGAGEAGRSGVGGAGDGTGCPKEEAEVVEVMVAVVDGGWECERDDGCD